MDFLIIPSAESFGITVSDISECFRLHSDLFGASQTREYLGLKIWSWKREIWLDLFKPSKNVKIEKQHILTELEVSLREMASEGNFDRNLGLSGEIVRALHSILATNRNRKLVIVNNFKSKESSKFDFDLLVDVTNVVQESDNKVDNDTLKVKEIYNEAGRRHVELAIGQLRGFLVDLLISSCSLVKMTCSEVPMKKKTTEKSSYVIELVVPLSKLALQSMNLSKEEYAGNVELIWRKRESLTNCPFKASQVMFSLPIAILDYDKGPSNVFAQGLMSDQIFVFKVKAKSGSPIVCFTRHNGNLFMQGIKDIPKGSLGSKMSNQITKDWQKPILMACMKKENTDLSPLVLVEKYDGKRFSSYISDLGLFIRTVLFSFVPEYENEVSVKGKKSLKLSSLYHRVLAFIEETIMSWWRSDDNHDVMTSRTSIFHASLDTLKGFEDDFNKMLEEEKQISEKDLEVCLGSLREMCIALSPMSPIISNLGYNCDLWLYKTIVHHHDRDKNEKIKALLQEDKEVIYYEKGGGLCKPHVQISNSYFDTTLDPEYKNGLILPKLSVAIKLFTPDDDHLGEKESLEKVYLRRKALMDSRKNSSFVGGYYFVDEENERSSKGPNEYDVASASLSVKSGRNRNGFVKRKRNDNHPTSDGKRSKSVSHQ